MAEKRLNTRIIHKHETEANWKLSSLIPMQGEIIVYDKDESRPYSRMKIGDGTQNVNALPFTDPFVYIAGTDTVIWTGNEEAFDVGALKPYYYISDAIPTIDDFANGAYISIAGDIPYEFFAEDMFVDDDGAIHAYQEEVIVINSNCAGKAIESIDGNLVFPYAGVYVSEKFIDHITSFVIPGYTGFGARKVIDAKYMPDLNKLTTVTMLADAWEGDSMLYSQTITCNGVTVNSKIDLQPTATQIVELQDNEITLMLQNDNGVVTAWAIGNKPTNDYEMQVLITEVVRV